MSIRVLPFFPSTPSLLPSPADISVGGWGSPLATAAAWVLAAPGMDDDNPPHAWPADRARIAPTVGVVRLRPPGRHVFAVGVTVLVFTKK